MKITYNSIASLMTKAADKDIAQEETKFFRWDFRNYTKQNQGGRISIEIGWIRHFEKIKCF